MMQPVPGMVLAERYRLQRLLGSGGMGSVWRAEDLVLGRPVAVKLLTEASVAQRGARERFRREARSVARLSHARIAGVYDYCETMDGAFIVMELIEGETLAQRLARTGRVPPGEAAEIAAQVAEALHAAHSAGILHRDIKPGNIMLTAQGVKVVDFGIATTAWDEALTATHSVVGTASYLAPERGMGAPSAPAADLYALGVVLYEMLAGRPPFDSENPVAVLHAHATTPPPPLPPDVPAVLADGCGRLLAKDPAMRPAPAAAVAAMLRGSATVGLPTIGATAATPIPPPAPAAGAYPGTRMMPTGVPASPTQVRHDRRALGVAAIAVVAVAGLAIWLTTSRPQADASTVGTSKTTSVTTPTTNAGTPSATTNTDTSPADTNTAILGGNPTDAQSALNAVATLLTTDVAEGVLDAGQGQTLSNQLNQVQDRIDQNRPQQARRTVTTMIGEVQNHVQNGDIGFTDGTTLLTSLNTLQGFLATGSGN